MLELVFWFVGGSVFGWYLFIWLDTGFAYLKLRRELRRVFGKGFLRVKSDTEIALGPMP